MKTKLLLLVLLISIIGCQSPDADTGQQEATVPEKQSAAIVQTAATGENKEYLESSGIRLNGKLPLVTSVKDINSLLGKPDSISAINWDETCATDFRSEESRIAYYIGIEFEQFGDSLDFQTIDFRKDKNLFLQSGNLKLDGSTTLEEISKHYPNAVKEISMGSYQIDGKATDSIVLPPSKELSERQWVLMFQGGKLIRIDDWFPC
jgi:hypothetical protein